MATAGLRRGGRRRGARAVSRSPGVGTRRGDGGHQPRSTSSARWTQKMTSPSPHRTLDPSPLSRPFICPPAGQSAAPRPLAVCLFPQPGRAARSGPGQPHEALGPARTPTPCPSGRAPPFRITHLRPRPRPNAEAAAGWRGRAARPSRHSHLPFPLHSAHPPCSAAELPPRSSAAPKSKGVRLRHHNQMAEPPWPAAQPAHWSLPPRLRHHSLLPGDPRRRLAKAAATLPGCQSRLHGDQVSVRRGCWGLENRAELVEPSKS